MPFAPISDRTARNIWYEDTGGSGPVIVFSHGFLMDGTMFVDQVSMLKDKYRCITWDQRGHGQTATDRLSPFDFYDSANDLSDLLALLGIERAVLAGMSQGGFLTLRCALTNPSVVRGLLLFDTEAGLMSKDAILANDGLLKAWLAGGWDADELGLKIAEQILGPGLRTSRWTGTGGWVQKWAATQFVNLIPSFNALTTRDDITMVLKAITAPALVIHGEVDLSVPISAGQQMAQGLANAQFQPIAGAGHGACLTHWEFVNPLVKTFLESLPA